MQVKDKSTNIVSLTQDEKHLKPRPRVRFKRAFFSLFIIFVIFSVVYFSTPLSRLGVIRFSGNNVLSRTELISLINISEDELFLSIRTSDIESSIFSHPVINQVAVSRRWINQLVISITEYEVGACARIGQDMYHILIDGQILHENEGMRANCDGMMISNLTEDSLENGVISLFVSQLMRIDPEIRALIQMIEYDPTLDIYRFSLSMIDGNTVKVTTHTMVDELVWYLVYLEALAGRSDSSVRTGIFHLDVGRFFEPHDFEIQEFLPDASEYDDFMPYED